MLHIMAEESKYTEKDHFMTMLYSYECQSQKTNYINKLFINAICLSSLQKCPKFSTMLAEIFQSSTFFSIQLSLISLVLHLLRAIFFSSTHSEQNLLCKGYLLLNCLCRQTHKVAHDKEQLIICAH